MVANPMVPSKQTLFDFEPSRDQRLAQQNGDTCRPLGGTDLIACRILRMLPIFLHALRRVGTPYLQLSVTSGFCTSYDPS